MSDEKKQCPFCGELIALNARKCIYCGEWLSVNRDMIPCKFCGEMVNKNANKCVHCGEWLKDEPVVQDVGTSVGYGIKNPVVKGVIGLCVFLASIMFLFTLCLCSDGCYSGAILVAIPFYCIFAILVIYLYMFPAIHAKARNHPQFIPILLVNIVFGETAIGWVAAMIWATTHRIGRHTHW